MKAIKRIVLFILVASTLMFAAHLYQRLSFASPKKYFPINSFEKDSTLSIGIIGDSWVSYQKLDSLLSASLLKKSIHSNIISAGKDGARTKQIYQSIFNDDTASFSCKTIIEKQPRFCIVIAGVNDAQSFTGAGNYAHHIILIVQTLLHYNIKPVLVELPVFDVEKAQQHIGWYRQLRNKVCSILNNEQLNNIAVYRQKLQNELEEKNLLNKIIKVEFDTLCKDFEQCHYLYRDALHLNKEGNQKLVELLSKTIIAYK
ncbi:MAG TPA: SGNH/GDSL hydrolase family protein [Ferruginibacter sp.]|nr:SGNH/GDSL hydrolase family protein [Ferruginibacter sp.]HRE62480.1 SGNH/GDSL hydrolase family protein [Ferruginibacter sp.]